MANTLPGLMVEGCQEGAEGGNEGKEEEEGVRKMENEVMSVILAKKRGR